MGKKNESTIENRVYLFDKLGAAFLAGPAGSMLASKKPEEKRLAMEALADLAYLSCVVSDTASLSADEVRAKIREGLLGS